jgi:hypothetical protein
MTQACAANPEFSEQVASHLIVARKKLENNYLISSKKEFMSDSTLSPLFMYSYCSCSATRCVLDEKVNKFS